MHFLISGFTNLIHEAFVFSIQLSWVSLIGVGIVTLYSDRNISDHTVFFPMISSFIMAICASFNPLSSNMSFIAL